MLPHCASSSFEALSNPYKITGWNRPTGDNEQPSVLSLVYCAGYGLRKGFIPPYHGMRYHLQEYSDCPPQNEKELFNLHHASLRSSVERAFTILKRRFRVIDNEPFWDFKTQMNVVLASYILHNHIVDLDPNDTIIQEVDVEAAIQPRNVQITQNSQGSQSYQTTKRKT
ncbi:hypothetical protein BC332_04745 [Capsicum chinense]|nr:hypothetical protein BC332_04745 [Capsicum chinense]